MLNTSNCLQYSSKTTEFFKEFEGNTSESQSNWSSNLTQLQFGTNHTPHLWSTERHLKEIATSMRHWRNEATQPRGDHTSGLVLPRSWSSQKEWTNQIRDQFSESQSSAWATGVPSHTSRRVFQSVGRFAYATSLDLNMGYLHINLAQSACNILTAVMTFGF